MRYHKNDQCGLYVQLDMTLINEELLITLKLWVNPRLGTVFHHDVPFALSNNRIIGISS